MNHGPGLTFRFLTAQVLVVVISLLVAATVATVSYTHLTLPTKRIV